MQIIPVIDLMQGQVVAAVKGNRNQYQTINSRLSHSSNVFKILQAYLEIAAFPTFYIADLDALTFQGNHNDLISDILSEYPEKKFWLDNGKQNNVTRILPENLITVVGSESLTEQNYLMLREMQNKFVLSLDFSKNNSILGPPQIYSDRSLWPEKIIIMTLDRVGAKRGPDFKKLKHFCAQYPDKQWVAAGGIRSIQDLLVLQEHGIKQALVASALHTGKISCVDIQHLSGEIVNNSDSIKHSSTMTRSP